MAAAIAGRSVKAEIRALHTADATAARRDAASSFSSERSSRKPSFRAGCPNAKRSTKSVSGDIVCPSEQTIRFYENVLSEVIALFPGPYVHTGGDETPKTVWNASPFVRSLERRYHLKDADAVQGWFDTRIETFLRAHGKRMIGWDEILGGNISRSAIIMSWRGISGGVIAASRGNDVVMTPTTNLYFDYSQGDPKVEPPSIGGSLTLRDVYDYDPAIDGLKAKQEDHILGAQANLWTEFVATTQKTEYMLLPRMLALAELTWTPLAKKTTTVSSRVPPTSMPASSGKALHFASPIQSGSPGPSPTRAV